MAINIIWTCDIADDNDKMLPVCPVLCEASDEIIRVFATEFAGSSVDIGITFEVELICFWIILELIEFIAAVKLFFIIRIFAEDIFVVILLRLGDVKVGFFENIPIIGSLGTKNETVHVWGFCTEAIFDHILFTSLNTDIFEILQGYTNRPFVVIFCSVEKLNAMSFL